MKTNFTLNKEREDIVRLFTKHHKLKFTDIEKKLGIRSNLLTYHLDKLVKEEIIEKKEDYYRLSLTAEVIIPSFEQITGKETGPVSVIIAAITNNNKICLLKREKRPYQGYWGMIGGKIKIEESIKETALREAKEETGLNCSFDKVVSVLHERVKESEIIKHALVIFLCRLTTNDIELNHTDEGRLKWFDLNKLPKNIIPSDKLMINKLLNKDFCLKEVVMEDKSGELIRIEVN